MEDVLLAGCGVDRVMLLELIDPSAPYGTPPKRELLYRKIIDRTRQVLGVQELTQLRHSILQLQRGSGGAD